MKFLLTRNLFFLFILSNCFIACSFISNKSTCTPSLATEVAACYHASLFQEAAFIEAIESNPDYFKANGDCIKCMEELADFFEESDFLYRKNQGSIPPWTPMNERGNGYEIWAAELKWLSRAIPNVANGNKNAFNQDITSMRTSTRLIMSMVVGGYIDPSLEKIIEQTIGGTQALVIKQFVTEERRMNY